MFDRFWDRSFLDLGANFGPTWPQLGAQDAPKSEKKTSPRLRRVAPGKRCGIRLSISTPFWAVLASILEGLGVDSGRFWENFWSFLAWFGRPFDDFAIDFAILVQTIRTRAESSREFVENKAENQAENKTIPTTTKDARLHSAVLLNFLQIVRRPPPKTSGETSQRSTSKPA